MKKQQNNLPAPGRSMSLSRLLCYLFRRSYWPPIPRPLRLARGSSAVRAHTAQQVSFPDSDGDGISDFQDNGPTIFNPGQEDSDGDGIGDVCDNCPSVANPRQEDSNGNGIGDACESATGTITNTNDSGAGSLRQALVDAHDGDTIDFDSSLNGQTITLTSGQLIVDKSVTITGPGADQLSVNGNATSRVLYIAPGKTVIIADLTITNGHASENFSDDSGGASSTRTAT